MANADAELMEDDSMEIESDEDVMDENPRVAKADAEVQKLISQKRIKDSDDRKVSSEIFDKATLQVLYKLANQGYLDVLNGANVFKDYLGIDIRTQGFIVAEPSTINNKPYKFLNDITPQPMPQELKKFILENATLKTDIKKEPYKKPTNVEVGDRDNQLFSYINNVYYKTRLDYDEVLCLALNFNENVLEKPFSEKKVEYKVKKVFQKDRTTMLFINLGE